MAVPIVALSRLPHTKIRCIYFNHPSNGSKCYYEQKGGQTKSSEPYQHRHAFVRGYHFDNPLSDSKVFECQKVVSEVLVVRVEPFLVSSREIWAWILRLIHVPCVRNPAWIPIRRELHHQWVFPYGDKRCTEYRIYVYKLKQNSEPQTDFVIIR